MSCCLFWTVSPLYGTDIICHPDLPFCNVGMSDVSSGVPDRVNVQSWVVLNHQDFV